MTAASTSHTSGRQLDRQELVAARPAPAVLAKGARDNPRLAATSGTQPRALGRDPHEKPHLFPHLPYPFAGFPVVITWYTRAPVLVLSKSPPSPIRRGRRPEPGRISFC